MRRDEWFARLCSATLQSLPDETARALRSLPGLDTPADPWRTPDLGPSVLASEIARRYAAGEHPDDIAEWCARAGLGAGHDALMELIVPVCERYRLGGLPFPRWWRPDELTGTLLRWYARWRLAGSDLDAVGSELVGRWEIQKTLDLRGAALVCLSACDSGVSAADLWRVDDYQGIDGALLACGARAVVSSLWSVTDAVSLLFTATMYHALSTGATVAQAYQAGIAAFARGRYRTIDHGHPVGALLQRAGVDWPGEVRELDDMGADLTHPFHWGVFKLSGLVGEPVMALRNAT